MACAAGLASISVYENENLAERAGQMGGYFLERLGELAERHPMVGEVRGRGLMVAAELVSDRQSREPLSIAKKVSELAVKKGLFLYPGGHYGNVLAFLPPLVIDEAQIDTAVEIVDEVLLEVS
jgi:4-aminobutyrate aminotransferase-like enzyme